MNVGVAGSEPGAMRLLYVCQRVPHPPDRGDKIASSNAIRHLRQRHSVCVAAPADSAEEIEQAEALRRLGVEVVVARRALAQCRRSAIRALPSNEPLSVAYFRSRELADRIREAAEREPFDVVIAFSSSMASYASGVPGVPLVADFVDLDSQKWALYGERRAWPLSWLYREESRRLLAFERNIARVASRVLVCTREELADCQRLLPEGRFEVLANGVDLDYFRPPAPKVASEEIVFTGVMDYFPNVEGVSFFCREVLPRIRRERPSSTFTIVGARPTRAVRKLAALPGVSVTGRVADVRPFLQRAQVAVVPLRLARGVQNKVLEALAMETPVVMTSAVHRGIDADDGEGFVVADDPATLAARTVALLTKPDDALALGRAGRTMVELRYVWEDKLAVLDRVLAEVAASASP